MRSAVAVAAAIALALVLVAASQMPAPVSVAQGGGYVPVDTWQSEGGTLPAGAWVRASGIDIAADGRVFVADAAEARVTVIDADGGASVLVPAAPAPEGLVSPRHLAVDADSGRVYVADHGADAVAVFGLDGGRLASWGGVMGAAGVALAADGSVVAGAAETGLVHQFAADGTSLAVWPAIATGGNDRIRAIDTDEDGQVYVLDGTGRLVRIFGADGQHRQDLQVRLQEGPVEAYDIDIDYLPRVSPVRRFWMATTRGLLQHVPDTGGWRWNPIGDDLAALAVHRTHGVYVAARGPEGDVQVGGRVLRLGYISALSGGVERTWSGSILRSGDLRGPEVVELGADGRAYVLDRGRRVQRFELDGATLGQLEELNPAAIAAAPDGTLYVTDGGLLWAYGPADWVSGAPPELWMQEVAPSNADANAVGIAVDTGSGDAVVLDAIAGGLRRFASSGSRRGEVKLPEVPGESSVWADIDAGPAGEVLVLDRGLGRVIFVAPSGEATIMALDDGARNVAAGPTGAVFTLGRDGWVRRYDRDGTRTAAFDATRFDIATASGPSDLDVGDNGDVFVTDRDADIVTRFQWDSGARAAEPPERGAVCRNFADKQAVPGTVDLGQTVEVRLTVRGGCGSDTSTEPLDIVLVLDSSGSMDGDKLRVLRGAAHNFVADVDLSTSRVGVVSFAGQAKTEQGLTSNASLLRQAIDGLEADGDTRIHRGLAEARAEVGRRGRAEAHSVFIVLSDGGSDFDEAKNQADLAKNRGVEIYSVGIQAWADLMREIASGSDHYFATDSARFLYGIFDRIAERVTTATLFRTIDVVDEVPGNMRYVPDSAVPAARWDASSRTLTWALTDVPFNGFGLRFTVEPLEPGDWPTNVSALGDYVDGYDQPGQVSFPVPRVNVIGPTPTPVTATATEAASPTPRATLTPTPRPTGVPVPVFVPLALKERCVPGQKHADVMLVLDASSSMSGDKIAAAKGAAQQFVRQLALPDDRVGVVAFSAEAWMVSELTPDASRLEAAIGGLRTSAGTRIDLGLQLAADELRGPRHLDDNSQVIVLLTDGRQEDREAVQLAARAARDEGVIVFAIGLGDDVDVPLLEEVAGGRAQTYLAPGPDDLADIYSQIAVQVPCPPKGFWGGR